jgi:hypothetical protein
VHARVSLTSGSPPIHVDAVRAMPQDEAVPARNMPGPGLGLLQRAELQPAARRYGAPSQNQTLPRLEGILTGLYALLSNPDPAGTNATQAPTNETAPPSLPGPNTPVFGNCMSAPHRLAHVSHPALTPPSSSLIQPRALGNGRNGPSVR